MQTTPGKIYQGRIVTLALESHRLPDGRTATFEIVRHPGGAAALPILSDGRVMLIRQFRPAVGGMVIEAPAGKLDNGEAPEECVKRELMEEIGYRAGRLEKVGTMHSSVGFCDECIHLYLARNLEEVPLAREADEFIELLPLSLNEALLLLVDGEITDAKTQLLLLHYSRVLNLQTPDGGSVYAP
ncbi:MAG: ADP-ribose pyrophosphatase [Desulfuromonadales bacterium GWD2_61_12]|nr:MAG: ADP-ribose pyrophosphatase [Desulfuromonadales bacterium GWD2_61_12]OGR33914.1 MAG: ADP-ribose pyrophosphatase [Desulfuromonadales bacterium GWC2_61_20]HAD03293.1 ADP-ribose pyrophosphatase [Desulfuromonas sp.]HBT82174.1 ADP-ribose pyrophosphatase [Desulfuromonas sp.]